MPVRETKDMLSIIVADIGKRTFLQNCLREICSHNRDAKTILKAVIHKSIKSFTAGAQYTGHPKLLNRKYMTTRSNK